MVNLSDLSTAGDSSSSSSSGVTTVEHGYGGAGTPAHYVLQTRNTSTAGYGFTFYDQDFGSVAWGGAAYSSTDYQTVSHWQNWQTSTFSNETVFFPSYSSSAGQVSSASGRYLNSIQHSQWGGAANVRLYSNGSVGTRTSNNPDQVMAEMKAVFNSDHSNRSIAYQFTNGKIKATSNEGFASTHNSIPYPNTDYWSVPNSQSYLIGTASYNKSLKKLFIIRSWSSTNATYDCYSNVDFDAFPSPAVAMTQSGVTVVTGLMQVPNMQTSYAESTYQFTPVLCDDGTLWGITMSPHTGLQLWGRTSVPTADGNFSPTYIGQITLTTSYGVEQGSSYGRIMMETRDRTGVLVACPYYYYGSGIRAFCVPKSGSSTNHAYAQVDETSSSTGWHALPWRDSGFCFYFAGNGYPNNYNGAYVTHFMSQSANTSAGGFSTTGNNSSKRIYLPYWGLPNTTNYPGLTKVADYDHLSYNNGAR